MGQAYVEKKTRTEFELRPPRHRLQLHSLRGEEGANSVDPADFHQLDDALELAAYLETGSPGAAVTGAWAAIEGLLHSPGERGAVQAADRLAAIVACAVERAELTSLVFRHEQNGHDQLADQLRTSHSRYEKVRRVEAHLRAGGSLSLEWSGDSAALDRVQAMIRDPKGDLERIQQYTSATFRRLYNQRNLVMHGGSFRSLALSATLRTAPALVGAGLDRIVHAQLSELHQSPLEVSARASTELALLGTPGQSWLVDLLGR